jgi:hypothetical protein
MQGSLAVSTGIFLTVAAIAVPTYDSMNSFTRTTKPFHVHTVIKGSVVCRYIPEGLAWSLRVETSCNL